jgi:uncharacterized protein YoxC
LTKEEAQMASVESLRITHNIDRRVQDVQGEVHGVGDKVQDVNNSVQGISSDVREVNRSLSL